MLRREGSRKMRPAVAGDAPGETVRTAIAPPSCLFRAAFGRYRRRSTRSVISLDSRFASLKARISASRGASALRPSVQAMGLSSTVCMGFSTSARGRPTRATRSTTCQLTAPDPDRPGDERDSCRRPRSGCDLVCEGQKNRRRCRECCNSTDQRQCATCGASCAESQSDFPRFHGDGARRGQSAH